MRSPSQWPCERSSTSAGRSAIGRIPPSAGDRAAQLRGARRQAAARVVLARPIGPHAHARLAKNHSSAIARQLGRSRPSRPRRVRRAGVIVRTLAAAGLLAMHRRRITAQPLRYVRDAAARSDDSMNTRSSKLSLAAILDTSIGRLHVLATVIMTVHLQPPMEFAVRRTVESVLQGPTRQCSHSCRQLHWRLAASAQVERIVSSFDHRARSARPARSLRQCLGQMKNHRSASRHGSDSRGPTSMVGAPSAICAAAPTRLK